MSRRPKVTFWCKVTVMAATTLCAPSAFATYDANVVGVPDGVFTYVGGLLLIHMANQPSSHPSCNPSYFAVDPVTVDAASMNRMYARVLAAHAMQESIAIGYDSEGDCVDGYIHVWRIG